MKKLMFGLACAAAVCAMADNGTNFEGVLPGMTFPGTRNDDGGSSNPIYFAYKSASGGSTDGSIVKAYGAGENLPAFNYGKKRPNAYNNDQSNTQYLELSTEGGTLWRGWSQTDDSEDGTGDRVLGAGVKLLTDIDEGKNVYVDTLVQFTPTEDGTAPAVDAADQMAIWLNVDATNPEAPVTNLCVLASKVDGGDNNAATYVVPNKAQGGIDIVPGQWYRLTVKTFATLTQWDPIPGFAIYVDGKIVKTGQPTFDKSVIDGFEFIDDEMATMVADGSVFASLWMRSTSGQSLDEPVFQAVGFKGSGAIDDLSLTTELPNFFEDVGSVDFTLKWDANVSAVSYTIGSDTFTIEDLTTGSKTVEGVEPGTVVTVAATAKDWYAVTAGAGNVTIDEEKTVEIKTALVETLADAGIKNLEGVAVADAKAWADANGLKPTQIAACAFALDAYLMNAGLDAAPALAIVDIAEVEGGWAITVKATAGEADINLGAINGVLKVKTAATLDALDAAAAAEYAIATAEDGTAVVTVTGDNTNFMKATVTK